MKHLLLLFLFSGSLSSFSQDTLKQGSHVMRTNEVKDYDRYVIGEVVPATRGVVKPDTLRCTLIVYYDSGPAILHTKPGFVVRQWNMDDVYLDDRKKIIKAPWEVYGYKIKK